MKRHSAAQFRNVFADLTEPVEVTKYNVVIGTWFPTGTEPKMSMAMAEARKPLDMRGKPLQPVSPPQPEFSPRTSTTGRTFTPSDTSPIVQGSPDAWTPQFRPVPKPTSKKR